jgi:polysaccharide pyruvyl transferase WcaK-like protein
MKVIEKITKKSRFGVSGIGVSVGPFTSNTDALKVKSFIERFDYLSVRDNASYSIVKEFNLDLPVIMAGDLAGAFQITYDMSDEKTQQNLPIIGVALCNFESFMGQDSDVENKRNLALIAGTIQAAKNCDAKVYVFSLNNHPEFGDDGLAKVLCKKLLIAGIEYRLIRNSEHSIDDIWRQIANCDAFLSVRLHGAIVAYLSDIPFALVEYHQKCTDFLEDIGQDDHYKLAGDINDSATVCHTIERLLSTRNYPKMTTAEYSKRSLQHFLAAPWLKKNMQNEH